MHIRTAKAATRFYCNLWLDACLEARYKPHKEGLRHICQPWKDNSLYQMPTRVVKRMLRRDKQAVKNLGLR